MSLDVQQIVALPFNLYGKMFARSSAAGVAAGENGNTFKEVGGIAKDVMRTPDIVYDMKSVWSDVKNLNSKISSPIEGLRSGSSDVSEWTFFKNTFLDEKIASTSFLRTLDKTMINTKAGSQIVEALGGKIVANEITDEAGKVILKKTIEGSTASQLAGNTLAKISGLNLIFGSILEVPDLVKSAQNGDFLQQMGRSGLNVTVGWASAGFFNSLFRKIAPTRYKSVAGIIGGAIGAVVSSLITTKASNAIFGKSIESQKREQEKMQEQQKNRYAAQNVIDKALAQQNTQFTSIMA